MSTRALASLFHAARKRGPPTAFPKAVDLPGRKTWRLLYSTGRSSVPTNVKVGRKSVNKAMQGKLKK